MRFLLGNTIRTELRDVYYVMLMCHGSGEVVGMFAVCYGCCLGSKVL